MEELYKNYSSIFFCGKIGKEGENVAILKRAKTKDELKKLTLTTIRSAYEDIAKDYNRILDCELIYCPECGSWKSSDRNFYGSDNTKSGYNHTMCRECVLDACTDYDPFKKTRKDNRDKTIATFKRMDWMFNEADYLDQKESISESANARSTAVAQLITMVRSLPQYRGKKFDDSIFESDGDILEISSNRKPRREIIKLFGSGFTIDDYLFLQDQYDDWKTRTQVDSKSQEIYVVQICCILLDIYKARKKGKDTDKLFKSLNDATQAANLQPRQNVSNSATDTLTFGQLIEKWENERPIPDPDPEFEDVDGIKKYINVFFKGHLAKMMGLKNAFTSEYDEYMKKYTVHKPTYEDDSYSEEIKEALFGKDIE